MKKTYLINGYEFEVEFSVVSGRSYAFLIEYNNKVMLDDPYSDEGEWPDLKVIECIKGIKGLK